MFHLTSSILLIFFILSIFSLLIVLFMYACLLYVEHVFDYLHVKYHTKFSCSFIRSMFFTIHYSRNQLISFCFIFNLFHRYPGMTQVAFEEACPVCRKNCNCKACLRLEVPKKVSFPFFFFFFYVNIYLA